MAIRLSKREMTERERVLAWLDAQPFSTSQRSKPAVPVLTPAEVREKYSPLDPQNTGQFFTPEAMAAQLYAAIEATGLALDGSILEPCGGLGALIAPLEGKDLPVTAYELDQTCAKIGERLAPWATWIQDTPFDHLAEIEGKFDWVIANPPFGTKWGLYEAEQNCKSGATRSEHLFLELALRALKPGGYAAFIAPPTFLTSGTKKFRAWLQQNGAIVNDEGFPLAGDFALTKINVRLFLFERIGVEAVPETTAIAADPAQVAVAVPAAAPAISGLPAATLERDALKAYLVLLRPAIVKGSSLGFRITAQGIELLAGNNKAVDAYAQIPATVSNPVESPLFALVPAATLVDLIPVLEAGLLTLSLVEGTLQIKSGASTTHIRLESGSAQEDFLQRVICGDSPLYLTGKQLALLCGANEAASGDEARPSLNCLSLTAEGTTLTAAAADGFMLALRAIQVPDIGARRAALPSAETLAKVVAKIAKAESVAVFFQKNGLRLHVPDLGVHYHFWDMAADFPDVSQVMTAYATNQPAFPIDPKRWGTFIKRTRSMKGAVVLANLGAQLYAQVDSEETGVTEDVLAAYPADAANANVVVSWELLRNAAEIASAAENVSFRFGDNPHRPPWITADGLTILLMPLSTSGTPDLVKRQENGAIPLYLPQRENAAVPA